MGIEAVKWIKLGAFDDARGNLRFGEVGKELPFAVQRVYYSYNVPADAARAGVCHREMEQILIAVKGGFTLKVDDGENTAELRLEDPGNAVYVSPMVWREVKDFTPDAVCLALASHGHDPAEQVKDYEAFKKLVG